MRKYLKATLSSPIEPIPESLTIFKCSKNSLVNLESKFTREFLRLLPLNLQVATDGFAYIKVEKNIFSPISQEFVGFIGIILG